MTRAEIRVGLVGLAIATAIVAGLLVAHGGDITALVAFGEASPEITAHAEDVLDRSVATRVDLGHDGRFFFLQSLDPLYLEPEEHAALLDRPVYRGQRMLYPMLAGAGGVAPAALVPWTMVLVNLAALAFGTLGTAALARRLGGSEWWGLAFVLNLGMIFEFDIGGAGIVAFAAAIWGTLALENGRVRAAAAWFVAAVLAREVMLLYVGGVCLLRLVSTRRIPWLLGGLPALAVGVWAVYLRLRLDEGSGADEVQEIGLPFAGMWDAVPDWVEQPFHLVVIGALIAMMVVLVLRAARYPCYLGGGSVGFVVLGTLLTRQVWWRFFDISRALAPIITAYVIVSFVVARRRGDGSELSDVGEGSVGVDESSSRQVGFG